MVGKKDWLDRLGWALALTAGVALLVVGSAWVGNFIEDDTLISLRYAERLLEGKGLTWNDGERVEGYSNLAWVLGSAALGALGGDLILAVRILAFACWGATFGALLMLARRAGATSAGFGAGALALGATASLSVWAMGALEQPLVVACLAIALWALAELDRSRDRSSTWAGVAAAALCLLVWTRPDAPLIVIVIAVSSFLIVRRRANSRAAFVVFAFVAGAPFLAWLAQLCFRVAYYGEWLPNPAFIKTHVNAARMLSGLTYVGGGLGVGWLVTAAGVIGAVLAFLRRDTRALAGAISAVALVWTAYVAFIGGDHFPAYRHMLVTQFCLVALFVVGLGGWSGPFSRRMPVAALALVISLLGPYVVTQRRVGDVNVAKRARWQWDGQAVGRMFGNAFGAERPLWAVTAAGCLPYFSGLPALDMLGLNDAHIARQAPDPSMPLAHDHGDGRYVLDRAPDLVTFGLPRGTRPAFKSGREMKHDPRFARDYQSVTFRTLTPISVLTDTYVKKRGKIGLSGSLLDATDGPLTGELVVPAYLLRKAVGHPLADGSLGARIDPRTRATVELPELPPGRYRARLRPENARVDIVVRSRTGATLEQAADDVFELRVPSVLRLEVRALHLSTLVGEIVLERLGPAVPEEREGRATIAVQLAAPIPTTPWRHLDPRTSTAAAGLQTFEPFTVSEDAWLCFNISGGRAEGYESQVGVRLIDLSAEEPTTRMVFTGENDDRPREVCADLAPFSGRSIRIEAFDESRSAHVSADGFVLHQP